MDSKKAKKTIEYIRLIDEKRGADQEEQNTFVRKKNKEHIDLDFYPDQTLGICKGVLKVVAEFSDGTSSDITNDIIRNLEEQKIERNRKLELLRGQ